MDIFKEDKYSDIYDPNVQSGRVLRQPVERGFEVVSSRIQALKFKPFLLY